MPGYKAHISFAVFWYCIILLIVYRLYHPPLIWLLELGLCITMGALFPDIDIKSKGQKYIYTLFFVAAIPLLCMQYYMIVALVGWLFFIPMMVKHRGIFHDPLYMNMLIAALWCVWYIHYPFIAKRYAWHVICFIIGMHSHIMLDYGVILFFKKLTKHRKKRVFRH